MHHPCRFHWAQDPPLPPGRDGAGGPPELPLAPSNVGVQHPDLQLRKAPSLYSTRKTTLPGALPIHSWLFCPPFSHNIILPGSARCSAEMELPLYQRWAKRGGPAPLESVGASLGIGLVWRSRIRPGVVVAGTSAVLWGCSVGLSAAVCKPKDVPGSARDIQLGPEICSPHRARPLPLPCPTRTPVPHGAGAVPGRPQRLSSLR